MEFRARRPSVTAAVPAVISVTTIALQRLTRTGHRSQKITGLSCPAWESYWPGGCRKRRLKPWLQLRFDCDTTTIDYDVSCAPASIRRDSNVSFFSS